jgi:hypothetical protein
MKSRVVFRAACVVLAVTLSACTSSHVPSKAGNPAGHWLRAHGLIPAGR